MTTPERNERCPFCGHSAEKPQFITHQGGKWGSVFCDGCGAYGPEVRTSYEPPGYGHFGWGDDAVEEWNKRYEEAPSDE